MSAPRKIVLTNQSAGYLFVDVANAFAARYDEVVLLAGEVLPMHVPLDPRVKVRRISRYNRSSTLRRMFSWVAGTLDIWRLLVFSYRGYDLLLSSNPPVASTLIPLFTRRRTRLLIYDIYPDGLVAGSFVQHKNLLYRAWAALNRRAYRRVEHIYTLTPGMATALEAYAAPEKISVVPVWSGFSHEAIDIPREQNLFLKQHQLADKFIVMYSGNLGKEYALETLVELAERFRNEEGVCFIIMGRGWKKDQLASLIREKELQNCLLLPYQVADLFLHSLAAFNVGVVSLSTAVSTVAIPSKTYNLLAAHRPVCCIGNEQSNLAAFLHEQGIGRAIAPGKLDEMEAFIRKLWTDKEYYNSCCRRAAEVAGRYTRERALEIVDGFIPAS